MKLVARNALLARRHEKHRLKPEMHRNMARLKDGPNLDGEGLAALVALVGADAGAPAAHLPDALETAAMRADRTFRPNPRLDKGVSGFFAMKVLV